MTFKWQGKSYDTSTMTGIETSNPAMPMIYIASDGGIFLVKVDRIDGVEVRLADSTELALLEERHDRPELLEALKAASLSANPPEAKPAHRHALIVEDDGMGRHVLGRLLRLSGYDISCAATISEARAKLGDLPQWLILDLTLPDGKGTDLLQHVRDHNLPIKVAITTGTTDPAMLSQVRELHPDAIFHKPFEMSDVMHWLEAA